MPIKPLDPSSRELMGRQRDSHFTSEETEVLTSEAGAQVTLCRPASLVPVLYGEDRRPPEPGRRQGVK